MTEQEVFNLYRKLNLKHNDICVSCIAGCANNGIRLSNPASIWQVGTNYHKAKIRLLFVGKIARRGNNLGKLVSNNFIDATEKANELYYDESWAYWSYTKAIASRIFKDNPWENIAFTNCIKCDDSSTQDNSNAIQKENCLKNLGVLWKEIEILKPHNIVFYTHWDFDYYIEEFRPLKNFTDKTDKNFTVNIGQKTMPWWERTYYNENDTVKILRVGHPERKKKVDFVDKITNWINNE